MSYNVMLESLIEDIGGCGKFQWSLSTIFHLSKTVAAWSMLHKMFNGQEPSFFCSRVVEVGDKTAHEPAYNRSEKHCSVNGTRCQTFVYDDAMHTVVSEVSISR